MIFDRWLTLGATTGLELLAGLGFAFSLYAPTLKETLHLSQPQLQGLGTAMLCGGLFGVLPGLVYDKLFDWPKLAPRLVAIIGLACHLSGYSVLWATISGHLQPSYTMLIINGLVLCNGPSWSDTVSCVVNVQNFPLHRGPVSGILKGFHGISASITAAIYAAYFAPDIPRFLLFLALAPVILNLPALVPLNRVPNISQRDSDKTGRKMLWLTGSVLGLYVYQVVNAFLQRVGLSQTGCRVLVAVGLFFLGCIILAISWPLSSVQEEENSQHEQLLSLEENDGPESEQLALLPKHAKDWTLLQSVTSVNFWLLFLALLIGQGFGITVSNNLGQQVLASGGDQRMICIAVLVFATTHGIGCLVMGPFSESVMQHLAVGRTAVLAGLSAGTALSSLLLAVTNLQILLPCVALAGVVTGGHWPLFPSTTADLFGARYFAAVRGILHISSPLGTALFSIALTGHLYEKALRKHDDEGGVCRGPDCFRSAFVIIGCIAGVQTLLSSWLHFRSKALYAELQIARQAESKD